MRKPKARFYPMEQVYSGKPYELKLKKGKAVSYEVCCHCNLVHLVEYTPDLDKKVIRIRCWQEDKLTKELREKS